MRWRHLIAALAVSLAVPACSDGSSGGGGSEDATYTFDFTIPAGTGKRANAGEDVDMFGERIDARVGDTLRIVNQDDRAHTIGPYTVAAGQTLVQTFTAPATYVGVCTTRPGHEFVISVTA